MSSSMHRKHLAHASGATAAPHVAVLVTLMTVHVVIQLHVIMAIALQDFFVAVAAMVVDVPHAAIANTVVLKDATAIMDTPGFRKEIKGQINMKFCPSRSIKDINLAMNSMEILH